MFKCEHKFDGDKYCEACLCHKVTKSREGYDYYFDECDLAHDNLCSSEVKKCDTINFSISHKEFDTLVELLKENSHIQECQTMLNKFKNV